MRTTYSLLDGTPIGYDRLGAGPPVVIVGGALSDRQFPYGLLAELLSEWFTVFNYDRRGRGDSDDTPPYTIEREIEDLEAMIAEAGGSAFVYGSSSGGNLALEAAARGLPIRKLAVWEPNFVVNGDRKPLPPDYVEHLEWLVTTGRRGDAVEYFMTEAVGMPVDFIRPMRDMPMWPPMEVGAHTLPYDGTIVGDAMSGRPLAVDKWAMVRPPTLVLDGGSTSWLSAGARAIADVLPNAWRRTLPDQTHDVAPEAIAPALKAFFLPD